MTEIVRKNPYSIILLDEIEKANPEVFNILLQVMEDGELTDAKGRKVDFKNTIIIMTSNLGTDILNKQGAIGFLPANDFEAKYERLRQNVLDTIDKHFRPEFLNRVDKVIVFKPLDPESIKKIAKLELLKLVSRLLDKKIKVVYSPEVIDWLAKEGFNPHFGARPIRKVISDNLETQISELLLNNDIQADSQITISIKNKKPALNLSKKVKES